MKPRVAIIYLCYGMEHYLNDVVEAIGAQTYPRESMGVVMISNGSPDNIAERISQEVLPRSEKDLPKTILIDDENTGFAGNNNQGIEWALEQGYDYVFLHNGDLKLEPNTIEELVRVAEQDPIIGSVQALVKHWKEPELINVSGGIFHIAGYGYARDNYEKVSEKHYKDGEQITYASGAAVLYRADALQKVGVMEEAFFMYHEDLELGLRLRIAGYKNVLAPKAGALHDYSFSRNPGKIKWMELYKWIVLGSYWKIPTLLLLAPVIICVELGSLILSIDGGWLVSKLWSYQQIFVEKNWKILMRMRKRAGHLREIKDRDLLKFVSGKIEGQESNNFIVQWIANPILNFYIKVLQKIIIW